MGAVFRPLALKRAVRSKGLGDGMTPVTAEINRALQHILHLRSHMSEVKFYTQATRVRINQLRLAWQKADTHTTYT